MRIARILPARARTPRLCAAVVTVGLLSISAFGGGERPEEPVTQPDAAALTPYAADLEHPWNRLHRALFVREVDGSPHVHSTDPLLYRGGSHLLDGNSHRTAVATLDQFLANSDDRLIDASLKRFFFQHDLWAAFDYAAWYPDDWVFNSQYEPAAIALRNRLARAIGRLALTHGELAALPDNYALAVKSKEYATDYDPELPERPFVPPDLFDDKGPWVRFHETTAQPMAERRIGRPMALRQATAERCGS